MTQGRQAGWTSESYEQMVLDFVAALLDEGRLFLPARLPKKREVYRETVEILGQMYGRAVVGFWIRAGGWSRASYVVEDIDETRQGRMWDSVHMSRATPRFGKAAFELAWQLLDEAVVMSSTTGHKPSDALLDLLASMPSEGEDHAWETVLVYVMSRGFARTRGFREMMLALGEHNPLVQLVYGARFGMDVDVEAVSSFLTGWGWALPWTYEILSEPWAEIDRTLLSRDLEHFTQTVARLDASISAVVEAALMHERHEWLLPVLDYFRLAYDYQGEPERLAEPLHIFTSTIKLSRRQQVFDAWAKLLKQLSVLEDERQRIQKTHPVDREAGERLFLSAWQGRRKESRDGTTHDDAELVSYRPMDEIFPKVENLRTHLQRVVG